MTNNDKKEHEPGTLEELCNLRTRLSHSSLAFHSKNDFSFGLKPIAFTGQSKETDKRSWDSLIKSSNNLKMLITSFFTSSN